MPSPGTLAPITQPLLANPQPTSRLLLLPTLTSGIYTEPRSRVSFPPAPRSQLRSPSIHLKISRSFRRTTSTSTSSSTPIPSLPHSWCRYHTLTRINKTNQTIQSTQTENYTEKCHHKSIAMGKSKKQKGPSSYNDFLDGEKLKDNAGIRRTLQDDPTSSIPVRQGQDSLTRGVSPPPTTSSNKNNKPQAKPQLTHFLCLPLVNQGSRAQLESSLADFTHIFENEEDGVSNSEFSGLVPTKAIRPVGTLHLTLGVMSLDEEKLKAVGKFLEGIDLATLLETANRTQSQSDDTNNTNETLKETPQEESRPRTDKHLVIDLSGLTPMQSPQNTSILYASPQDPTARLLPFAKSLRSSFENAGFLVEDTRELRLHATVLNTIYAKPKGGGGGGRGRAKGHGPNAKSWMKIDARGLVERYRDVKWAEGVVVDRVQVCRMGARKIFAGDEAADGGGREVVDERYDVVFEKVI